MLINVPQYIDVEDKIVGPLTAKQLGWIIAMSVILLILYKTVPGPVFFILGLPVAILFVSLAFLRPYGQPLISFLLFDSLIFFVKTIFF